MRPVIGLSVHLGAELLDSWLHSQIASLCRDALFLFLHLFRVMTSIFAWYGYGYSLHGFSGFCRVSYIELLFILTSNSSPQNIVAHTWNTSESNPLRNFL